MAKLNVLFIANCFVLGYIGQSPLEAPFLFLGQLSTALYFLYFALCPLINYFDTLFVKSIKYNTKYLAFSPLLFTTESSCLEFWAVIFCYWLFLSKFDQKVSFSVLRSGFDLPEKHHVILPEEKLTREDLNFLVEERVKQTKEQFPHLTVLGLYRVLGIMNDRFSRINPYKSFPSFKHGILPNTVSNALEKRITEVFREKRLKLWQEYFCTSFILLAPFNATVKQIIMAIRTNSWDTGTQRLHNFPKIHVVICDTQKEAYKEVFLVNKSFPIEHKKWNAMMRDKKNYDKLYASSFSFVEEIIFYDSYMTE